jgi:hypothetical protein
LTEKRNNRKEILSTNQLDDLPVHSAVMSSTGKQALEEAARIVELSWDQHIPTSKGASQPDLSKSEHRVLVSASDRIGATKKTSPNWLLPLSNHPPNSMQLPVVSVQSLPSALVRGHDIGG